MSVVGVIIIQVGGTCAALTARLVQHMLVLLDVLARFQHGRFVIIVGGAGAFEAKIGGESGPARGHAGGGGGVCDVEELAAAGSVGVQGGPDGKASDDVGGGFVEEGGVGGGGAGEWDFGAWAFDQGVEGEVDGPVGGEVEGAAVGGEADL